MRLVLFAICLALAPGCSIYFGGDDTGDDICAYDEAGLSAAYEILNPENLACEDWGGYGGGCGYEDQAPMPSWGLCDSECQYLDESMCLDTGGCRAAYDWACYTGDAPCDALIAFMGCYPVDMSGPVQGSCDGLDAWTCSLHDDCIALHDSNNALGFVSCAPEGTSCSAYTTEPACSAAAAEGCIPEYFGSDCTCDAEGNCTCAIWTFSACVEQR